MKFDPTVVFYLKNQTFIDEWHELSKQIPALAHRFFTSLEDPLENAREGLPDSPRLQARCEGPHPKLLLFKTEWATPKGRPRVAIGIEWRKIDVDFRSSYSGLWTDRESKERRGLSNTIRKALDDYAPKHGYAQSPWWPLFRDEEPPDDYWDNLDAFRDKLVTSLSDQWRDLHGRVDKLLSDADTNKP